MKVVRGHHTHPPAADDADRPSWHVLNPLHSRWLRCCPADPAGEAALSAAAAAADPAVAALLADEALPLPVSPAAQLHLSFSLCNAHPSPHSPHQEAPQASSSSDDGANSSGGKPAAASSFAAFSWDFSMFEAQFVAPWKNVLSAAARLTVSSQVRRGQSLLY